MTEVPMRGFWPFAKRPLRCSFCGRDEHSVANLVAGPRVLICDACVDLCAAIVAKERDKVSGD
jgi:ATP-dependent Clp protease ATP-binding subunit ClpX